MGSRLLERRGPAATMQKAYFKNWFLSSTLCYKVAPRKRLWPSRIAASDRVPADREHIQKHLNAVVKHIDLRRWRMPPPNGNLERTQAMMPRQVEQFGIEPEPLDALLLEKDLAAFATERFEAALCIDERKPQDHPHDLVEDYSCELAESGLVDGNEAAIESPGAYSNIVGCQRVQKFGSFLDRRRQVSIRKKHITATRFKHSVANAEPFPSIHTVGNDPQSRKRFPKRFRHFCRAVFRTVVYNENFRISSQTGQIRCNLFER